MAFRRITETPTKSDSRQRGPKKPAGYDKLTKELRQLFARSVPRAAWHALDRQIDDHANGWPPFI
jgi:hypothetical protein